jgi:hypothetical protein
MPLKPVSDPALLEALEGQAAPAPQRRPVSDPALLQQLEGQPDPVGQLDLPTAPDDYKGLAAGNVGYVTDYLKGIGQAATKERAPNGPSIPGAGLSETALHLGSAAAAPLFALPDWAITKMGVPDPRNPAGTYAGARDKYVYEPRTSEGRAGAEIAGAALKPVGDAFGLIGSGYSGIAGKLGASRETQQEIKDIAPDVVGAGLALGSMKPGAVKPKLPTKEQLGADAKAAYKRAEDAGIAVSAQSFDAMKMRLLDDMEKQGIDPTLHPDATAALKRIGSMDGPVTLEKLETLRRIAQDAEKSQKPADARLAGELVDRIDDYVEGLQQADVVSGDPAKAAALKEARDFYSRKKKSEEIDRLIERAELSPQGMDTALRGEFRTLAKNEKRMRRFTKEEREAIVRAAKGGPTEFVLRQFGKFASGPFGITVGSGLGWAAGGPVGAAVVPPAAALSRMTATSMTKRNARMAEELMRRGPRQPQLTPAKRQAMLQAMALSGGPARDPPQVRMRELARLLAQQANEE